MKNIWRLVKLIPNYRRRIASVVLVSTALGLTSIAIPYLFKNIIDQIAKVALAHGQTTAIAHRIWWYLGILAAIRLIMVVLGYAQDRVSDSVWLTTLTKLRTVLFEHLLGLSIDYYEITKTGEIMQRISNGVSELNGWLYNLSNGALLNVVSLVFYIALVGVKSPIAGAILLVIVALNVWNSVRRVLTTKAIRRVWQGDIEQAFGTITETVANVSTVRSLAAEPTMQQRYHHWIERFETNRLSAMHIEWSADAANGLLNTIAILAAVGLMAQGAVAGRYTPGDLYLVLALTTSAIGNLSPLTRLIANTGDVETSSERVTTLLDIQPTVTDQPNAQSLETIGAIEFRHVSFNYPGKRRRILHDVSFNIAPGQTLALVGPSGTGKTTVIKLLMRFYDPTEGQVLIDGVDIRDYTQASLRGKLGVVMQDVALLNDTVEENLRFASPNATRKAVRQAAEIAHADIFIDKLAEKYKTLVGERGIKLSGGEKQRVAIARAILRNPQLIILDEATSALDSESERYVQEGLQNLMEGRTAVIIAHRLSTVMKADQIVVLQNGRVLERGTHTQLIGKRRGNLYAKLYALQTSGALK